MPRAPTHSSVESGTPTEMAVRLTYPSCDKSYVVSDKKLGKRHVLVADGIKVYSETR